MSKIEVRTFNGLNINKIDPTMVEDNDSVAGSNIRIDNPYGTLSNQIGIQKWSDTGLGVPIQSLFQLRKHRFTSKDSFFNTMFFLSGRNLFNGEISEYDYNYFIWGQYSEEWEDYYVKVVDIYATQFYGGAFWDTNINSNNLFIMITSLTEGEVLKRYTINSDCSLTLAQTYNTFGTDCRCLYVDYVNDFAILSFYQPGFVYDGLSYVLGKVKLSDSSKILGLVRPGLVGTGNGTSITQFTYDPDTEYIYWVDYNNNRIAQCKFDADYTDWKTYGSSGSGVGNFKSPYGCYYDIESKYYYICDTSNSRIIKTDIEGNNWTQLTTYGDGFMQSKSPINIVRDKLTGLFIFSDASPSVNKIVKTDFKSVWTTYSTLPYQAVGGLNLDSNLRYLIMWQTDKTKGHDPLFLNIDSF